MNPVMPTSPVLEPLLNVRQVAVLLGVPVSWVYDNVGQLPVFRVGKALRFRASELEAWLEQQRPAPLRRRHKVR